MRTHRLWFLVSFCGLVAGCGSGNSGGGGGLAITSVSVTPPTANVTTGATQQYTSTVAGTGPFISQVTWTVNDVAGGNATVGTITSAGLYTAPVVPPSPNTATIKAISTEDSTKTGPATATVVNPAPVATALSPASVSEGSAALQLTVTGSGFNSLSSAAVAGNSLATTFVDNSHLQVQLPASDLASPGSLAISVTNPSPGGGTGAALQFPVLSLPGGLAGANLLPRTMLRSAVRAVAQSSQTSMRTAFPTWRRSTPHMTPRTQLRAMKCMSSSGTARAIFGPAWC